MATVDAIPDITGLDKAAQLDAARSRERIRALGRRRATQQPLPDHQDQSFRDTSPFLRWRNGPSMK